MVCAQCGTDFVPRTGRGGKSLFCPDCQAERRRMQTELRGLRHALAQMTEFAEAVGPTYLRWKREVVQRQANTCLECGKRGRLYMALSDLGELYGLCLIHFEAWVASKRGRAA